MVRHIATSELRAKYGGGGTLLFGAFSIADLMFAPVCLRFKTFQPPLTTVAQAYVNAVAGLPAVVDWVAAAENEGDRIAHYDDVVGGADGDGGGAAGL